ETEAAIATGKTGGVKIELTGERIRVWLNGAGEPALDVTDPKPLKVPGFIGIRTWGAALHVDELKLHAGQKDFSITPVSDRGGNPNELVCDSQRRALQSFCLLLFNLNELIYVD